MFLKFTSGTVITISSLALVLMGFILIPLENPSIGIDKSLMDKSVKPSDNLFQYANGSWIKNNPIPASEPSWGAFNELQEQNNKMVRTIIEEAASSNAPKGTIRQKVGDFYSVAMDTLKLEADGTFPIKSDLNYINSISTTDDLITLLGYFHSRGVGSLFSVYVTQDQKKSSQYILYLNQGGIGLPDRDYYFKDDDNSKYIRNEYRKFISKAFQLAGKNEMDEGTVNKLFDFETVLAKFSMTRVELRDDEKQYNKFTLAELTAKYPSVNWQLYFNSIGATKVESVIVSQPEFFTQVNNMFKSQSIEDWKLYLNWCLLNEAADKLNTAFELTNFHFYGTVLSGTKAMRPRWKRIVNATNYALGEAVGQLYVEKAFSAESKKKVNEMVDNLMEAYKERINGLEWMSQQTKQKALIKLASFSRKLGYPDQWKDYSSLEITKNSYYQNVMNARLFGFKRMINKLGKPIDKTEWGISPQTVNAYYNPQINEIVFPAAIMQPPFFNPDADDAVNYGGIGAVIGHEITHGFDDQGSKYDEHGNLNNWWTTEDRDKFNARTKKLVEQFNGYKALDDLNVNGELTLGENIADLGGLTMAYQAYKRSLKGKPGMTIDGFSPEQRFFLGWAQVWRVNYRPESLRQLVLTNVHSPEHFRAIGAPSNLTEFYEAFQVKPGDSMHRDESIRVKVW